MNELKQKAEKIKLVAFDVDGVLTNGEIFYTDQGTEIKSFRAYKVFSNVQLGKCSVHIHNSLTISSF